MAKKDAGHNISGAMTDAKAGSLDKRRILIVEDEFYLADDLSRSLRGEGAEVIGPVGTLAEAEALVDGQAFDCAILDMNLRGQMAFPIADRLRDAGVPFLIATGYNSASLPERFDGLPRIEKPFDPDAVVAALPPLLAKN
jgi:DNA-binding response OmpR family regulator